MDELYARPEDFFAESLRKMAGQRTLGRVQGLGIEPENFREYAEGDDLRFLDWNAYARLDELSIRTFRADRQVEITILADASASMGVPEGDDKPLKYPLMWHESRALVINKIDLIPYDVAYEEGFEDMQRRVPDAGPVGSFCRCAE